MTPARKKVYAFLNQPYQVQFERANALGLTRPNETGLPGIEEQLKWVERAKEAGCVDKLFTKESPAPAGEAPKKDETLGCVEICYACQQDISGRVAEHNCHVKLTEHETAMLVHVQAMEFCDHYCCGNTPQVCHAKFLARLFPKGEQAAPSALSAREWLASSAYRPHPHTVVDGTELADLLDEYTASLRAELEQVHRANEQGQAAYTRLRERLEKAERAMERLANEAAGFLSMADDETHGLTNKRVLAHRIAEARAALAEWRKG